jgi:glycerol-3-phosphate dehydrogenase (NAD(P)+)
MRLGVALGGAEATFSGLAGMGDLVATCTSPQSRNRNVGYELGKGRSIDEIINEMYMVAEGVKSAPAVIALAEKYKIQMPIAEEVYNVTRGNSSARNAFRGLLRAEIGAESEPG